MLCSHKCRPPLQARHKDCRRSRRKYCNLNSRDTAYSKNHRSIWDQQGNSDIAVCAKNFDSEDLIRTESLDRAAHSDHEVHLDHVVHLYPVARSDPAVRLDPAVSLDSAVSLNPVVHLDPAVHLDHQARTPALLLSQEAVRAAFLLIYDGVARPIA
jgi:hypothetical protein